MPQYRATRVDPRNGQRFYMDKGRRAYVDSAGYPADPLPARTYRWTLVVVDGMKELLWVFWPTLFLLPVFLPGTVTVGARNLLIAAAVLWVVLLLVLWWVRRSSRNGESTNFVYALLAVLTVLFVVFTVTSLVTGVEPCPGTASPEV